MTTRSGEVLALLAEDEAFTGTAGPLDRPALGKSLHLDRLVQDQVSPAAPLPESIGRYRVISRLGVGGMGVVYEAEQDNPRRTRRAQGHQRRASRRREMLRRFEHEAQVLGRLQHPGIAQIFEAGTSTRALARSRSSRWNWCAARRSTSTPPKARSMPAIGWN